MTPTIRTEPLSPAFTKHHVNGLPFNGSINVFTEPDTGDPHDHPFDFVTHILYGGYVERIYTKDGYADVHREPGNAHLVKSTDIHKIISLPMGTCVTFMVPKSGHIRKSGFYRFEGRKVLHRFWDEDKFKQII